MGTYVGLSLILAIVSSIVLLVDKLWENDFFSSPAGEKRKHVVWPLVWAAANFVFIFLLAWGVNYLLMPVLAFNQFAIWLEIWLVLVWLVFRCKQLGGYIFFGVVAFPVLGIGTMIYSWDWFHAAEKQKMLEVVEMPDSVMKQIVSPIATEKMCTVSPEVAQRVISTKMGNLKNTYSAEKMTKQSFTGKFVATLSNGKKVQIDYKDQLVYVAVLEHKTVFTWSKSKFSPAYALVDANDESKAYIITEVNGEPLKMRYTNGACFGLNLERHLRANGYASVILDDLNIEIDENGRPYSPVTLMKNTIAFGTPVVTGVAVVDVQTGEIKEYGIDNAPAFVNMIQPEDLIESRVYWWGDYVYGYWHFSERDNLLSACDGMDVVQTNDGCYFYVGIRASNDEVGTQGYMLISTRTGKAQYFKRTGISEQEATRVLEANTDLNLEMNQGVLTLTEPLFYNIEGLKTYFATYVSTSDMTVKYYGFCSADNKSVWGYGKTMEEAKSSYLTSYYKNLETKPNIIETAEEQNSVTAEVEILEKVQEGEAYYFRFKGYEGKIFYGYSGSKPDIRWAARKVRISFNKTDAKLIPLGSYEIVE